MPAENYGEKAGAGLKGVFKSINDVGEALRTNINGAADSGADAVFGGNNQSHADSQSHASSNSSSLGGHSTGTTTTSSVSNDSEKVRRDINQGIDDAGRKLEDGLHKK